MTNRCGRCGKALGDGSAICSADAAELTLLLQEAAGHAEDAWTVIARQTRYGAGSRATHSRPLPVDFAASEDYAVATNTLSTWARDIGHQPTNLPDTARWLAQHVNTLRQHPAAGEAFDELHDACRLLERLVDRPEPPQLRLVGMCDCGKILYAPHGRDVVQCKASNCGASWNVTESQDILRAHLDERLVTAGEAAHLGGFLDTDRTVKQIRALVDTWGKRHRLDTRDQVLVKHHHTARCEDECDQVSDTIAIYRFGDIANLMATTPRRKVTPSDEACRT